MRYRVLGRTGIPVSEIGFGTWGLGGEAYGPTSDAESIAALHAAFDRGVTFCDTSDVYGRSEEVLGQAIQGRRDGLVLATKVGLLPHRGFVMPVDLSAGHIRSAIDASLGRLRTDHVDVYLLHSPQVADLEAAPEAVAAMRALKAEGKVRAWGISARSPADAAVMIERFDPDAIEVNYNIIDQRCDEIGLFDLARRHGTGMIARTPLCFGYLSGTLRADALFEQHDHRTHWPVDQLRIWAEAPGLFARFYGAGSRTAAQFALQFCLAAADVSTVIPGMLTAAHVEEDVAASGLPPLTPADLEEIRFIYRTNSFYDKTAKTRGR